MTRCFALFLLAWLSSSANALYAQDTPVELTPPPVTLGAAPENSITDATTDSAGESEQASIDTETVTTLVKLQQSINELTRSLETEKALLKTTDTAEENHTIKEKIDQLNKDKSALKLEFESVAAQVDANAVSSEKKPNRSLTDELTALLQPILTEARRATDGMRQKAELSETQEQLENRIKLAHNALENLFQLRELNTPPAVSEHLSALTEQWRKRLDRTESQLAANRQQLKLLDKTHGSLMGGLRDSTREFVQTRGLYLLAGVSAFFLGSLVFKLLYRLLRLMFPVLKAKQRSFRVRLFQLIYFILCAFVASLLPAIVFYSVEDWLLFSLMLLIMFGLFWSARTALSQAWRQALLFLNIGPVREGERIVFDGLPWKVSSINLYTYLDNPVSGLRLRLPLTDLLSMTSRPIRQDEPWFPCQMGDWLLFNDGYLGQVTAISYELIELLDLAGSTTTMTTHALLQSAPKNLSGGTFICSYLQLDFKHKEAASQEIPALLQQFLQQRVEQTGLTDRIQSVTAEFSAIKAQSLEIAVFVDLSGIYAREYFRLGRFVQRGLLDAAQEYHWSLALPPVKVYSSDAGTPPALPPSLATNEPAS